MREFLRGGYKTLQEPTVVSNHGRPAFTVIPYDGKKPEPADHTVVQSRTSRGR